MNPEGFIIYQDTKIKYLCYNAEYYKTCVVQQPMLINHVEKELKNALTQKAQQCFNNLKVEYEKRRYDVNSPNIEFNVLIEPGKLKAVFLADISIAKGNEFQSFNNFEVIEINEMYELLSIAQSIIDFESTYGDSETTLYLQYYPNLKIEKTKLSDGSKIYRLSNVVTKDEFTFASRSLSWPPGYGLEK